MIKRNVLGFLLNLSHGQMGSETGGHLVCVLRTQLVLGDIRESPLYPYHTYILIVDDPSDSPFFPTFCWIISFYIR